MNSLTVNKVTSICRRQGISALIKKIPFLKKKGIVIDQLFLIYIIQCNTIIAIENRAAICTRHHP